MVSGEASASAVGLAVLERGGNAVDAAVATALALSVVHPEAGNLGGGGFAVLRVGVEHAALDFREVAPAAARATMYLDEQGEPASGASLYGPLAAGVPGSPAGYFELHRRFGRLPWKQVVAPAIALARDGFEVSARTARALAEERENLARFPETAAVWLPAGRPPAWGERLRIPDLAATLESYAERGPAAILGGQVAEAIAAASRRYGGVLSVDDLAAYRPEWREPLRFTRFGWDFTTMPLPSSGGIVLGEILGLLERLGWGALPPGGVERAHLLTEAFRRAYADRFLLGDPASTRATSGELLDPTWLDRRAASVSRERATPSAALEPYRQATPENGAAGADTTHISVIDGEGNLVALTTTLNDLFGCRLWVPGAGFFLNNEMDDFTTAPGRANDYGLIQGEANAVAPGRRMLSSMSPTLAERGGDTPGATVAIVLGGRGGSAIPTAVAQVLLALWDGDGARAAVARPRLHAQWLPDRLEVEKGALTAAAMTELARRGHTVVALSRQARVSIAARRADGTIDAAGDPRGPEVAQMAQMTQVAQIPARAAVAPRAPVPGAADDTGLQLAIAPAALPIVRFTTALGEIDLEIDAVRAPVSAANFLRYVDAGHYDGGRFHRTVRPDTETRPEVAIEVIQGGVAQGSEKDDLPPIPLERTTTTGLRHRDGTLSMARDTPDTATSDFFICLGDQPLLDFGGARNPDGQGFAAFGRVVRGMEVVRQIQAAPAQGQALTPPIAILTARRLP